MFKARFLSSLMVLALILSIIPNMAMAANNAEILESQSSVPSSMRPGETRQVQIEVKNTGTTTWRESTLHRLGADSSINQVDWSGFACGGYRNHTADQRVFLCHDVGPGGTHTFTFNITMPSGATGSRRLAIQMVQDGVQWFGEGESWAISVASDSSGVTVFEHCDYGGYSVSLPVGDYRLSDLINRGIRNDDLSSIEVPGDYRATLYEHDNFQGDSWVVDTDISCFVAFGWDDRVSSIRVDLNGGGGFPDSITGGLPKGPFGSGGQTDEVTEPGNWRWSEWFYGHQGIDRIAWQYDGCGGLHNYAMGWHGNDLIEYLMKFGGEYSRLRLRGIADRPGPVELWIYIDGQYEASAAWSNNDDCNEDVAIDIEGISYGTHAIAVRFVNDYYNPPEDRNFYLDGLLVERSSGGPGLDLLAYIIPENENFRVYSRLRYPGGGTADEVFAYRDGGWSDGLRRWFFVKNPSGENWEEFGYDSNYIYRYRDTSWANTCQDGAAAFYQVTDQDRSAFARWLPRRMEVGETWTSPVSHYVDAGYNRANGCRTDTCSSVYEGWVQNRIKLVAHHSSYTTIWGYTVNDVIELADPYNPYGDHFFYARGYGLVGFEGPAAGDQGRFTSGAYAIDNDVGGPPNWVSLCGR